MYGHVFVGGTFDGLHKGHQFLISEAFRRGKKVTIGLTTDHYVSNIKYQISNIKYTNKISNRIKTPLIAPYSQRKASLEQWLRKMRWERRATITPIDDPYEPASSSTDYEALVVSTETASRGEEINKMRKDRGLVPVAIIEVPMVSASDGHPISSTRVRNHEVDEQGNLVMPESLRTVLAKPLGTLVTGAEIARSIERYRSHLAVAVGDVATKTLLSLNRSPALVIVDRMVGRQPSHDLDSFLASTHAEKRTLQSGPGFIAKEAIQEIKRWGEEVSSAVIKQRILVIDGEEDLLALPAIAFAPLGTIVYYGQPPVRVALRGFAGKTGEGIVAVEVTAQKRKMAKQLLTQFLRLPQKTPRLNSR